MVGALRWPGRHPMPVETGLPSVKARAGSWHVLQAMEPSADSRASKNKRWPSATFSGVCRLSAGIAARVADSGKPSCRIDFGWASRLAPELTTSAARISVDGRSALRNRVPSLKPLMKGALKPLECAPAAQTDAMPRSLDEFNSRLILNAAFVVTVTAPVTTLPLRSSRFHV